MTDIHGLLNQVRSEFEKRAPTGSGQVIFERFTEGDPQPEVEYPAQSIVFRMCHDMFDVHIILTKIYCSNDP